MQILNRKVRVVVQRSGNNSIVQKSLNLALKKFQNQFQIEYISMGQYWPFNSDFDLVTLFLIAPFNIYIQWKGIAKNRGGWSSKDFCKFVEDCEIFICTGHPVQADEPPPWDFREHLRNLYEVIKNKITFPDDPKALLDDPVFRQDKSQLHELIGDFMTPTLIVNRPTQDCAMDKSTLKKIYDFCKSNYEVHKKNGVGGWHIKGSFTTSNRGVIRAFTIPEVPRKMRTMFNRWGLHSVPDCQLQRTFSNSIVSCDTL